MEAAWDEKRDAAKGKPIPQDRTEKGGYWVQGTGEETETSITGKLARGTFAASFFLACLAVLERDGLRLDEIWISRRNHRETRC